MGAPSPRVHNIRTSACFQCLGVLLCGDAGFTARLCSALPGRVSRVPGVLPPSRCPANIQVEEVRKDCPLPGGDHGQVPMRCLGLWLGPQVGRGVGGGCEVGTGSGSGFASSWKLPRAPGHLKGKAQSSLGRNRRFQSLPGQPAPDRACSCALRLLGTQLSCLLVVVSTGGENTEHSPGSWQKEIQGKPCLP